ncbi:hypothetical protein D3C87_411200 [compost metagenome]
MKKQFLALSITLLVLISFSCKKGSLNDKITGTWEHVSSIGGLMPTAVSKGTTQLKLTENNYEFLHDGKIIGQGSYKITDEKSWNGDPRIIFDDKTEGTVRQYIKVSKKNLTIFVGASIAADGVEHHYKKVKN